MICRIKADTKILITILLILGALIIALALTSCATEEVYPYKDTPRQHVNEKCRTIRNTARVSVGEFLQTVGREAEHLQTYHHRRIYRVKIEIGRDVSGKYIAYGAVIYYD
jgi:hypothetical protein